jgi:hypothetical protein
MNHEEEPHNELQNGKGKEEINGLKNRLAQSGET